MINYASDLSSCTTNLETKKLKATDYLREQTDLRMNENGEHKMVKKFKNP